ncbi:MAG: ferrous iron transporter B [Clostridia bacterium]|nr:ferrous iron transporter B [Clostridia bacterium]
MEEIVLLVGNPNAGKSTLFNRLTGGHAHVGNWHGVTVDALEGRVEIDGKRLKLVDLPGIYNAEGRSMEEKFACRYVAERPQAALIFVAECSSAVRALSLLNVLTKGGRRCMLVLTKQKRFEREGGKIDKVGLEKLLGIPVCYAEDGAIASAIAHMLISQPREVQVSGMGALYVPPRQGLSRADNFILNGFFGIPIFAFLLFCAFFFTFQEGMPGDIMKSGVEWFFTGFLGGFAEGISSPIVKSLVQSGILQSLGSVLCFLPQIALLHLFLILLEESGLMSRLAVLTDGTLHKIGLSGRAVFSLLMGFGCTAAAITTTRGLDDRGIQRRAILCLPYISCSAKLPVYLALSASFFENPFLAVLLLYAVGIALSMIVALFLKGQTQPLAMELAPLQIPHPFFVTKSLLFQIKQFIIKVATVILAFFLVSWMLSSFDFTFTLCAVEDSMLAKLCGSISWVFAPAGMNDWRIAYAAISGLIAKENVAGAIAMFYGSFPFGAASAFAFAIFILTCSPCVSAIAASARELGARKALLYATLQTGSALILCYAVYFCLIGGAIWFLPLAAFLAATFIIGIRFEKVHRNNRNHSKKVHRRHLCAGIDVFKRALKKQRGSCERREGGGRLHTETAR